MSLLGPLLSSNWKLTFWNVLFHSCTRSICMLSVFELVYVETPSFYTCPYCSQFFDYFFPFNFILCPFFSFCSGLSWVNIVRLINVRNSYLNKWRCWIGLPYLEGGPALACLVKRNLTVLFWMFPWLIFCLNSESVLTCPTGILNGS
jgi:hypothetical protein